MNQSLTALKRKIRSFNVKPHTARDFWRITRREGIRVDFWHLRSGVHGFYGINRRYKKPVKYIVLESKLLPDRWLKPAFHELTHHFLHAPVSTLAVYFSKDHATSREERHADMISLIFRLPRSMFLELVDTPFDEIHEFTKAELIERKRIYELWGE